MSIQDPLDPRTSMGRVTLLVEHLDRMTAYYERGVGLQVLEQGAAHTVLGRGGVASLRLEHAPHLRHAPRGAAGLFHTAVLFGTEAELLYQHEQGQDEHGGWNDHLKQQEIAEQFAPRKPNARERKGDEGRGQQHRCGDGQRHHRRYAECAHERPVELVSGREQEFEIVEREVALEQPGIVDLCGGFQRRGDHPCERVEPRQRERVDGDRRRPPADAALAKERLHASTTFRSNSRRASCTRA